MDDIKKNIRRIRWLFLFLFLLIIYNLLKFVLFDSTDVISNSQNPRLRYGDLNIKRGQILDNKKNVLAKSYLDGENYVRQYYYGDSFAHVVGHLEMGKSGIELKYNFELQKLSNEIYQRIKNILLEHELQGNSIVLTLNSNLQQIIYNELKGKKGAVVVTEPSTGKIISMVSLPGYNSNTFIQNWDELREDVNSPLINRATQGLYPPGSVFKIVTSLGGIEHLEDYYSHTYTCLGEVVFLNNTIRCFNLRKHGLLNMHQAFSVSCNTYFSALGSEIGPLNLRNTAEKLYFNKEYPFILDYVKSSFVLDEMSLESEVVETAIGQGKTLVTPLHMAMITSAVANGGIMMQPYIVDSIISYNGKEQFKYIPKPIEQIISFNESEIIKDMMTSVTTSGTALDVRLHNVDIAAKTGTAENSQGDAHGWFVAFAPAENPKVAVSILLENSNGPREAIILTRKIIELILKNEAVQINI